MQWKMLQLDEPQDFVIATGYQTSVRNFIEVSSQRLGWGGIVWNGSGLNEVGRRVDNGEVVVRVDSRYFRPTEVSSLLGDASKARAVLGWQPTIYFEDLVSDMVDHDLSEAKRDSYLSKL